MKTQGQFTLVVRGDTAAVAKRQDRSGLSYLLDRLLSGQIVAEEEFGHYGIEVQAGPAAILNAAADYLEDGFNDELVANLREITSEGELEEAWPTRDDQLQVRPIDPGEEFVVVGEVRLGSAPPIAGVRDSGPKCRCSGNGAGAGTICRICGGLIAD